MGRGLFQNWQFQIWGVLGSYDLSWGVSSTFFSTTILKALSCDPRYCFYTMLSRLRHFGARMNFKIIRAEILFFWGSRPPDQKHWILIKQMLEYPCCNRLCSPPQGVLVDIDVISFVVMWTGIGCDTTEAISLQILWLKLHAELVKICLSDCRPKLLLKCMIWCCHQPIADLGFWPRFLKRKIWPNVQQVELRFAPQRSWYVLLRNTPVSKESLFNGASHPLVQVTRSMWFVPLSSFDPGAVANTHVWCLYLLHPCPQYGINQPQQSSDDKALVKSCPT